MVVRGGWDGGDSQLSSMTSILYCVAMCLAVPLDCGFSDGTTRHTATQYTASILPTKQASSTEPQEQARQANDTPHQTSHPCTGTYRTTA